MLVEFNSVVTDYEEQTLKQRQADLQGEASTEIFNSKDNMVKTVIDMSLVEGWEESYVYFNHQRCAAVRALFKDEEYGSRWLIISHIKFKMIWEHINKEQVFSEETILET